MQNKARRTGKVNAVQISLTPEAVELARSRGSVMALDFVPPLA